MKKLNIGCGYNYDIGWINCDISDKVKADFYFDCGKDIWPFDNNTFDIVKAEMVFEHLQDYNSRILFLKELWRVCKKDAKIKLTMPHFASHGCYGDLQHARGFSSMSFDYFAVNKTHKNSIMHNQEIEGNNALFEVQPHIVFGKLYKLLGIELFANHPRTRLIYEMFLSYIFMPRELHFELKVVK